MDNWAREEAHVQALLYMKIEEDPKSQPATTVVFPTLLHVTFAKTEVVLAPPQYCAEPLELKVHPVASIRYWDPAAR